jgi:hypothetical protein
MQAAHKKPRKQQQKRMALVESDVEETIDLTHEDEEVEEQAAVVGSGLDQLKGYLSDETEDLEIVDQSSKFFCSKYTTSLVYFSY